MRILVTGGAGYVGSVTTEQLVLTGHEVVVLDSLATGHREAVAPGATLSVHSVRDKDALVALLRQHHIEAVLHCAARSLVGQSMQDPGLYYAENVVGGVALLDALREAGVDRIVFSSTAAVYGEPEKVPIRENAPTRPVSPYGASKLAFEGAMAWYAAYGLRSVSLRYFNVAGASEHHGERHDPETHLIPSILRAALGRRGPDHLRRRLPDRRRHGHPRLHPRARPGRCPHRGARADGPDAARPGDLQPGLRRPASR